VVGGEGGGHRLCGEGVGWGGSRQHVSIIAGHLGAPVDLLAATLPEHLPRQYTHTCAWRKFTRLLTWWPHHRCRAAGPPHPRLLRRRAGQPGERGGAAGGAARPRPHHHAGGEGDGSGWGWGGWGERGGGGGGACCMRGVALWHEVDPLCIAFLTTLICTSPPFNPPHQLLDEARDKVLMGAPRAITQVSPPPPPPPPHTHPGHHLGLRHHGCRCCCASAHRWRPRFHPAAARRARRLGG
jgi:hypothetical protein